MLLHDGVHLIKVLEPVQQHHNITTPKASKLNNQSDTFGFWFFIRNKLNIFIILSYGAEFNTIFRFLAFSQSDNAFGPVDQHGFIVCGELGHKGPVGVFGRVRFAHVENRVVFERKS